MLSLNAIALQSLGAQYENMGAMGIFNTHEAMMRSAASVSGYESSSDIARLASYDKAVALQGIQAQSMYFAGQAIRESAQNMMRQDSERRKRMMANGAIFVS